MHNASVPDFTLGYRKSLDGARGLAILYVLLSHVQNLPFQGGFIGVDLFFVLSGFLITTLLLEEHRATGDLRLRSFYARRALRLLPALLVVLAVIAGLSAALQPAEEAAGVRRSVLIALFYSSNWFMAWKAFPTPDLTPTWSLSVEEQFYLVWPLLLLCLLRMKASTKSIAVLAAAGMLMSAAWRAVLWRWTGSFERAFFGSDAHADGLLAGALAALLIAARGAPSPAGVRALNWAGHLTLGALLVYLPFGWPADSSALQGGILALNLGMASLVACLVFSPGPLLRGLFESAPLVWLGRISYGVYLWHIVLGFAGKLPGWRWYLPWPVSMALTVGVAALSYVALERPLLRLKRRFERVPRSGA